MADADVAWVASLFDRLGVRERGRETVRAFVSEAVCAIDAVPFSADGRTALRGLIEFLAGREK